jgi:hypothetical protein
LDDPSATAKRLTKSSTDLQSMTRRLPGPDAAAAKTMLMIIECFRNLTAFVAATLSAAPEASRHLDAAHLRASAAMKRLPNSRFPLFAKKANAVLAKVVATDTANSVGDLFNLAGQIPFPVFQTSSPTSRRGRLVQREKKIDDDAGPFVIKVMLELATKPWINPQVLAADTDYDLSAQITVARWPKWASHLELDFATTLSKDDYRISLPPLNCPSGKSPWERTLTGHLSFSHPQSALSEPIAIKLLARFVGASNRNEQVSIVGYHELRARISDPARTPLLSKYSVIDERIVEILAEIDSMPGVSPQHRVDFIEALSAINNYMGICLQQALYKTGTRLTEAEFHQNLLLHMRTFLGEEVEEGARRGGGPNDIHYRTVTIEVKVERRQSNRDKMIHKYIQQPVQYSSAAGAQLGILCILDLTKKQNPPGSPKNNLSLHTPAIHGFESGSSKFESKVAVVIIDGNLRLPSSYSKGTKRGRS